MQKTIITVIGNVGAGKSTAMPLLQKALNASVLDADILFQTTNPFRDDFLNNMPRWSFTNELWLTFERVKLLREHIEKKSAKISLVDSGLLMSWVYTYGHYSVDKMTKQEWYFYDDLYKYLTGDIIHNIAVIHFSYSLDTLLSRIKKRGRDYELAMYKREYLEEIEAGIMALREKLAIDQVPIIEITEEQVPNFEENKKDAHVLVETVKNAFLVNCLL